MHEIRPDEMLTLRDWVRWGTSQFNAAGLAFGAACPAATSRAMATSCRISLASAHSTTADGVPSPRNPWNIRTVRAEGRDLVVQDPHWTNVTVGAHLLHIEKVHGKKYQARNDQYGG